MSRLNQRGIAHVQVLMLLAVLVVGVTLTFWRVSKNSNSLSHESGQSQEDTAALISEAKFIDEDHDLKPLCTAEVTENCENEKADHDFDNDGIVDSEDTDDDNDGTKDDSSKDDSDNDDVNDSSDTDDDNDGVKDSSDPDDDNDGQKDVSDNDSDDSSDNASDDTPEVESQDN